MTHTKCPGLIRICLLFAVALTLSIPASAEWNEKVLYSFQGVPDGQPSKACDGFLLLTITPATRANKLSGCVLNALPLPVMVLGALQFSHSFSDRLAC